MSPLDALAPQTLVPAALAPRLGLDAPPPPADRPLLGLTILLVEDSRLASEGMRLMCLRSGARLRRADSLLAAERHLRTYRPGAAIVDLHLPDGSGLDLLCRLRAQRPRIDAVLATSGDDALEGAARASGADAFLPKPIASLAAFQAAILACLPPGRAPQGPRPIPEGGVEPDPAALRDDLCHAAEVLSRGTGAELDYVARFLAGVARAARDDALVRTSAALHRAREAGADGAEEAQALAAALLDRLDLAPAL